MELKEGYIEDFISAIPVRATPEEIEAVQIFSQSLVKDYGYPKKNIRTRPQWRVKARPSDIKKEYPVDIAIFTNENQTDDNLYIVVECKKKNRTDGKGQLQDYLRFSSASLGVWFNGRERLFLKKREVKGKVYFDEIPNIPRYGQRVEDIGKFKRSDLKPATNLKTIFKAIRHYLAANAVGITRDEILAQQLINIIFCKIYDEQFTKSTEIVTFRAGTDEKYSDIRKRIELLFDQVKEKNQDVLNDDDTIKLDAKSLAYVIGELQNYSLTDSERDAVGDAFEVFIGPALKGGQGQFFTPRNVVQMVLDMLDPGPSHRIIDPACGSGGFLIEALRHVWKRIDEQAELYNWSENATFSEKQRSAINNIRGIDKDEFLSKVAKAYMAIIGDGRGGIFCENSLENPKNWSSATRNAIQLGSFDIVVTNPPFGKKLAIDSESILKQYELGYIWKKDGDNFIKNDLQDKQPPQILFIERCLNLLKPGGRLGIVLLESIFGMPKYRYVVDYITSRAKILAIVTLPEDLFQPNTHAKTCVIICENSKTDEDYPIFMCDVKRCGHDSRGNPTFTKNENGDVIILDEIPKVAPLYLQGPEGKMNDFILD